jgi:multiple sugar transport system substrate-binding protein
VLRGITWDHPRGKEPLLATAHAFSQHRPEVRIEWEVRSLKDFAHTPLHQLAGTYDLIAFDHPFVGEVYSSGDLIPLDTHIAERTLQQIAEESIGKTFESYCFNNHLWALPIDAAAQVSAYRPDLLSTGSLPATWDEALELVADLSRKGESSGIWPLAPVDCMCSFLSLCANRGADLFTLGSNVVVRQDIGEYALDLLQRFLVYLHPSSLQANPIEALERMSMSDEVIYCPLLFGYVNYSRPHGQGQIIKFGDMPGYKDRGPLGSLLGGVGLGVSAYSPNIELACEYTVYVAHPSTQMTIYAAHSGQPASRRAWIDRDVNTASNDFYYNTIRTMEGAYLRPRYPGFIRFHKEGGQVIHRCLGGDLTIKQTLQELNCLFQETQLAATHE